MFIDCASVMFSQSQGVFVAGLCFSVRNPQAESASHPVKPALTQTKNSEISCRHCRTKTGKNIPSIKRSFTYQLIAGL